jgi:predicted nucleotidyltransferase component of viral defense system
LNVTRDERLLLPAATRSLIHSYSDAEFLAPVTLPCYALEEMLAEKLRAVGGQRRFAVSRDLYDIYQLTEAGVSVDAVLSLLPHKFAARGVELSVVGIDRLLERHAALEEDWQNRLSYLVADREAVSFARAWTRAVDVLGQVKRYLNQGQ